VAAQSPDRVTLVAFVGIVFFGGFNAIAIKYSNSELPPFWGATVRFGLAAALLLVVLLARRIALPRGQQLLGSVLYGILGFGVSYALAYWALLEVPAGTAMIILALVPLLTLVLAVVHRLEPFRWQGAAGSLVAVAGIAIVFGDQAAGTSTSLLPMVAILVGALAIAESSVIVKRLPRSHPIANNAVAMAVGMALLLAVSLVAGEAWSAPQQASTIAAVGFLVVVGSVGLFMLFLFVIERWTASSTSYTLLLMPLVTVAAASVLVNEPITAGTVAGGALVLAGTYVGAFAPSVSRPLPGLLRRPRDAMAATEPPTIQAPCP
jgi:drug/metabolite transporter (DMT)-like permease